MTRKGVASVVAIILIGFQSLFAQISMDKRSVTGSWLGKISAGAIELRIVFNLSLAGSDSLVATLDSPDQGAKNIKLGPVSLSGDKIKISAGALLAEYNGVIINDTTINGTWKQAGNTAEVNLRKLKTAFTVNRPQDPKPPFPYTSEDVSFTNARAGISLAGTLTIPLGPGPFPAVILISGSGAQNRNEEIMGHKPFLVLADHLSRNGIAVLRYDDRGVGKSQGNYASATSADLATDAEAAFTWLVTNGRIDKSRTGLIGHSEGGLIAPIIAAENQQIAFIVSLSGPGVPGDEIIIRQSADISRLSGVDEKVIREGAEANKRLFDILKKEPDNLVASEKMMSEYKEILAGSEMTPEEKEKAVKQLQASLSPTSLTWMRYFVATDPALFWKKVKCPVLALNGEKDLQVAADVNLPAIDKALRSARNKEYKTMILPELNHLFQHSKTGLPSEYSSIEETFAPEALKVISGWILGL